jgi:hypothetical protein
VILFFLFSTGFIYTGGKFTIGVVGVDNGGNLPPVVLVAKFAGCS